MVWISRIYGVSYRERYGTMGTITQYEMDIAYKEGWQVWIDNHTSLIDNPYDDVSSVLAKSWEEGWWDAFYSDGA